jgi:uncharacterized membrane protein
MKTYNQIAGNRIHRIEAISDGVFAVALTLLVLDIKTPVEEAIHTEGELLAVLCKLMPKFLTYFLSFMTLGIFWTGQNAQFAQLDKYDRNLNWMSLFFLMVVSLVPFTTAFLSEHIHFKLSIGLYWLNIFLLGLLLFIHWNYAYRHGYTSTPEQEKATIDKAVRRRIVIAQSLYAAGALLCFVNIYASIFVIILVQLNYAFNFFSKWAK